MLPMEFVKMDNVTGSATVESPSGNFLRQSPTLDASSLAWTKQDKILDEEVRRWFERNQLDFLRGQASCAFTLSKLGSERLCNGCPTRRKHLRISETRHDMRGRTRPGLRPEHAEGG